MASVAAQPQYGDVPSAHESGAFEAYGARRRFPSSGFWTDDSDGLLYLFHLHGFEALAAYATSRQRSEGGTFWRAVIESWLASEHRPRNPSWHPYPTSLRLIAWSLALSELDKWDAAFRERVAGETHRQALYLKRTVEHDIGGNHVLTNAAALCFAGAVVPRSGTLGAGLRLLERQCERQFLSDGGHEERSTSYHRQALAYLHAVSQLLAHSGRQAPAWLEDTIARATRWQRALAGPDERLPLLGDSWEGPPVDRRLTEAITVLRDTGYVVLRHDQDQLVIDAGALCPPHLPPHAHADCLSFVLWVDGRPVVVDPGSYTYSGPERDLFRGTAAHNTVTVAGEDQCVFWGPFRACMLPTVSPLTVRRIEDMTVVQASHDGYRRLGDSVIHHRTFIWRPGAGVVIVDRLAGRGPQEVTSRLCLAAGALDAGPPLRAGSMSVAALGGLDVTRETRPYSPALGVCGQTAGIAAAGRVHPGRPFGWTLLRAGASASLAGESSVTISDPAHGATTVPLTPL